MPVSDGRTLPRPTVPPVGVATLAAAAGLVLDPPTTTARVTGVTLDSRRVVPGDLYAALPGAHVHGAEFVVQAARAGATAVLTDERGAPASRAAGLATLVADDPRSVLGSVAARVYGRPGEKLLLVGATGTNGKTTTVFLIEAGLRAAGHLTGLVGTVETRVAGEVVDSVRTTPEAPEMQALLALMVERGCTAAAMEVSSHALALGRVDGLVLDVAVFTNLSQDHLDFHPTLEDYYLAKASLFAPSRARFGVINADDEHGRRLAREATIPLTTFSASGGPADWRAVDVQLRADGSTLRVEGPAGERAVVELHLPGAFNAANGLAAVVALVSSGVPLHRAAAGLAELAGVPGRMETIDCGQPFAAIVDFAHTPLAVETLLASVRAFTPGRVILVLGCGGDRDPFKRPAMGRAAVAGADVVVLTSDNPRSEDPAAIVAAMLEGAGGLPGPAPTVEFDRAAAIARAVSVAEPGDTVLVAGKGHELGQEVAGTVRPFDDRVVLRAVLERGAHTIGSQP